jgi:glycosyltransferase involved in cell wall biosynthesis
VRRRASSARPRRASAWADAAAEADFAAHHGSPQLAPLTVVIPAYNEADNIGRVLDSIPEQVCGLAVSVLVVVDGGHDGTEEVVRGRGAYACVAPLNRGQGAALRLGYRMALDHGARYLATIDADGQYDPGELAGLVQPLVDDEADLVTGSRRLGSSLVGDRVRAAGVVVFASVITILTGHRVTDPAFGLRAMKAEVPAALTLEQSQYQAAELLIAAILGGFRVAERPGVMRPRTSGKTKKGTNLIYGYRYARAVLATWLRDR